MIDRLISFSTAKLAKEKGCDMPCDWRYDSDEELCSTKIGMHGYPNRYSGSYAAYTETKLKEWLEGAHDITFSIEEQLIKALKSIQ